MDNFKCLKLCMVVQSWLKKWCQINFHTFKNTQIDQPIRREIFKPSQGIFSSFSQPGQKNFSHLQKILNSFGQSGESFYTPSQRIFYSSSQSRQKYFWHLFKQYFYFSNQPGQSSPSQRIFYSSSQSGQKNHLMVLFRRIKNISKKLFHNKKIN